VRTQAPSSHRHPACPSPVLAHLCEPISTGVQVSKMLGRSPAISRGGRVAACGYAWTWSCSRTASNPLRVEEGIRLDVLAQLPVVSFRYVVIGTSVVWQIPPRRAPMTLHISPHAQDGLSIERSADMKTSLAIVLATIALTFGAMLSFTSGVAAPLSGKSPGVFTVQASLPSPPGPGPYRGNR
jgi:hypothetical protein